MAIKILKALFLGLGRDEALIDEVRRCGSGVARPAGWCAVAALCAAWEFPLQGLVVWPVTHIPLCVRRSAPSLTHGLRPYACAVIMPST